MRLPPVAVDFLKRKLKSTFLWPRRLLRVKRPAPDFIVIGGQKCGTTFAYDSICRHPSVLPAIWKEVHYFDTNFARGPGWYLAHFASDHQRARASGGNSPMITGEASPYYLHHPEVPSRVASLLPEVKLIAFLRNPVDRAYSHYQQHVREGRETQSFEAAIKREAAKLEQAEAELRGRRGYSYFHHHFTYLDRGIYTRQITRWSRFFKDDQLLILSSEELFASPRETLQTAFEFLELSEFDLRDRRPLNVGRYPPIANELRDYLESFYEPHNRELYALLGRDMGWRPS